MHPLTRVYGESFLRYVLALGDDESLESIDVSGGERGNVLNFLAAQASTLSADDQHGFGARAGLAGLTSYVNEASMSLVNLLRTTSGGTIEVVDLVDDPAEANLLALARDVWPIYLLPLPTASPRTFWMSAPLGIYQHPAMNKIAEAIIADADLAKLFPGSDGKDLSFETLDDFVGCDSIVYESTGRGGSLQLVTLVGFLLSDAVVRVFLKSDTLTWQKLCAALPDTLQAARLLAKGKIASDLWRLPPLLSEPQQPLDLG